MSYNTHFYFADAEFPRAQWDEVLQLFEAESLPANARYAKAAWLVRAASGSVVCELRDIRGKDGANAQGEDWSVLTDCTKRAGDVFCCARSAREFEEVCIPRLERWFVAQGASRMFESGILDGGGKLCLA